MVVVLVTGGMGFIGSNFIRVLLNSSQDFKVINDLIAEHNTSGNRSYEPASFNPEDIIESDKSMDKFNVLQGAIAASERVFGLLDTPPKIRVDAARRNSPRHPDRVTADLSAAATSQPASRRSRRRLGHLS